MRLGFKEGWAGRRRRTAVCPNCASRRARYSRRHYDGVWYLLFKVRPVKCSECSAYFPIAGHATIRHPETDPVDLHIPFRPSELDEPAESLPESGMDASGEGPGSKPSRISCPVCGSRAVHTSRPGGDESISRAFEVRTSHRCARCNASFRRTSPARLALFGAILLGLLGGLSYLAITTLGSRGRANASPRIKKDQITQPPPPVFR